MPTERRVTQPVTWRGLLPLAGAVLLFSSAWPVTKEAIGQGAAPIWFALGRTAMSTLVTLSLIPISEPPRLRRISYAVFCL